MKFQIIEISNPPDVVLDLHLVGGCLLQVSSDSSGSHYLEEESLLGQKHQSDLVRVIEP